MIITISGMPGSGKNTVAKMLTEKLGYELHIMGDIRRSKAKEKGMTLDEYNKLGEVDPSTDKEVDAYQAELAKGKDNLIIVGRTSFHFIPKSFKIYLDVNINTGAERIFEAKRKEEKGETIEHVIQLIEKRVQSDKVRYAKYYDIDVYDITHYDLVIDTTNLKPEQILKEILDSIPK